MIQTISHSSLRCRLLIPAILLFLFLHVSSPRSAPVLFESSIISVNDGDTVTLTMDAKSVRCRLIGIDAPEMGQEPWGLRAKEHLRQLLKQQCWRVSVEVGSGEHYDKYKRLLVYLWTKDRRLINEQMLQDGYAVLFTYRSNSKYRDRFAHAQKIAQEKQIGIWGQDGLKEKPLEYKIKHPKERKNVMPAPAGLRPGLE